MEHIKYVYVEICAMFSDYCAIWPFYSFIYFSLPVRRYQVFVTLTSQDGLGVASIVSLAI